MICVLWSLASLSRLGPRLLAHRLLYERCGARRDLDPPKTPGPEATILLLHVHQTMVAATHGCPQATPEGSLHHVKRHDVPSVHTLARRQPAMSLLPLGIRREHLRREHRRPLRAVPVERLTQFSRMWSGEQALHDRSATAERAAPAVAEAMGGLGRPCARRLRRGGGDI